MYICWGKSHPKSLKSICFALCKYLDKSEIMEKKVEVILKKHFVEQLYSRNSNGQKIIIIVELGLICLGFQIVTLMTNYILPFWSGRISLSFRCLLFMYVIPLVKSVFIDFPKLNIISYLFRTSLILPVFYKYFRW